MSYGSKPKVSTGGTVSAAVGSNAEYRHDPVKKKRNPTTRGSKQRALAKGLRRNGDMRY